MSCKKKITILGITGSIGQSTVKVILSEPEMFDVYAVSAHKNVEQLAKDAISLKAKIAIIADETLRERLEELLSDSDIQALSGAQAIEGVSAHKVDLVMAAIMGFAGLRPIIRALEKGINVAIANKEPLVAAGAQIMEIAENHGAKILPVDSEHNAIFQVFENDNRNAIDSLILTASGGPFLDWDKADMDKATPEQAIAHPNWDMGKKISVDSASMMNKALEIIEAHYLFNMPSEQIKVLIHPQSCIHSMVSYNDGSILSQMGASDMCTPIAYALSWPERMDTPGKTLNLEQLTNLTFRQPDFDKFPSLAYAYKCLELGQHACIAMNAANEVAVETFLNGAISFGDIMKCVSYAVDELYSDISSYPLKTIEDIEKLDDTVRNAVRKFTNTLT